MEELWEDFAPFADKQFLDEIETNLKSRFWEMYLGCSFLYNDFNLELPDHKGGPDLKINYKNTNLWVEAVTPQKGVGEDKIEKPAEMEWTKVPTDKMVLRIQNSIKNKKEQYFNWLENEIINKDEPFILAVNASEIPNARQVTNMPLILRAISQFGDQYFTFSKENFEIIDQGYHFEDSVSKSSGTVINKNVIENEEYNFISGFLYSCADPLNRPENMGDDYILIHNPIAINKLPIGFLKLGREFYREENQLKNNDYRIDKVD
jgi:hypothetical protein